MLHPVVQTLYINAYHPQRLMLYLSGMVGTVAPQASYPRLRSANRTNCLSYISSVSKHLVMLVLGTHCHMSYDLLALSQLLYAALFRLLWELNLLGILYHFCHFFDIILCSAVKQCCFTSDCVAVHCIVCVSGYHMCF